MVASERRKEIMRILCRRRFETIGNLASEFGVSERTIRRDIETLSLKEPIYTQAGRYGGGIYVVENYSAGKIYFSEKETKILHKLYDITKTKSRCVLTDEELNVFSSIITNCSKPHV